MANTSATIKSHRSKLARFSAKTFFVSTKPGPRITLRPRSAVLSTWSDVHRDVRAGACAVPSSRPLG